MKNLAVVCVVALFMFLCAAPSFATTYNVGPGQTYTNIRDVPWESLVAGDTVNIYYRSAAYQDKFNITAGGTSSQPITVHGVPDGSGNLPVINASGAVSRAHPYYYISDQTRALIYVGRGDNHPGDFNSSYITIENLEIKNAKSPNTFTATDGTTQTYGDGAHAVYAIRVDHLTIRNCNFHDNGEGYFFSSNDTYGMTSNMLVEGCNIANNGISGSEMVHGSYCESLGITYQYNHYAANLSGCSGSNLKDRSANTVIRYNWFEEGFWNVDIIDPEDSTTIANDSTYGGGFVYGNIFVKTDSAPNTRVVHYGGDGSDQSRYRDLPLQFYNNTVVSRATSGSFITRLFQGSLSSTTINAYNNILYDAVGGGNLVIAYNYGNTYIGHNWITTGFVLSGDGGTGHDDGTNITGTDPGFVDYANQDYHLTSGSACKDHGQALPSVDLPDNNVTREYVKHLSSVARASDGTLDIGAYEYGTGSALSITTSSLPADTVNVAYNQTLAASGGTTPYTWSIQSGSLPAGLALTPSSGAITGTPTASGTSNFTAKVTDNMSATATKALSIVVNAAVSITTSSLPAGTIGGAYNQTLAATGGTGSLTWSVNSGSLPAGLSLTAGGVISGTPTATGTSSFTAKAQDTVGASATKALSIVVNSGPLTITTSSLPGGNVGAAYNQTLSASGGTPPYSWSLQSGSLPAGLSLSSGGAITGTPTTTGTSSFTAKVTDNVSATATQALSIVVSSVLTITTSSLPGGTMGTAYNQTLAATGGTTPYTWSINAGSLPGGLSLTPSTGAITGTPTASGTSNFTAKVTDNVSATATQALSIAIAAGPSGTLYQSLQDDNESTTTSTAWTNKISLNFTPATADTWVIMALAEYAGSSTSYSTLVRLTVDGTTVSDVSKQTKATSDYVSYATSYPVSLSAASHTINIDYCSSNASATAHIRRAHIVALAKSALELYSSTADSIVALTSTTTNYATLTFTPSSAGNYLLVYSAEISGDTSVRTNVTAVLNAGTIDDGSTAMSGSSDYMTFWGFNYSSLTASSQTVNIAASKASGSGNIRRCRLTAIRMDGSRFTPVSTWSDATTHTTTSTSWQRTADRSFSNDPANHLSLTTARITNSSTAYATNTETEEGGGNNGNYWYPAVTQRTPQLTSDNMGFASIDVHNCVDNTAYYHLQYDTTNASGTAGILNEKWVALTLTAASPVSITTTSLPADTVSIAYNQTLAATGGTTPYTWSLSSGSLPAGLALTASSGAITGTPTATGTSSFTAKVTDASSGTATQALSIVVNAAVSITTASLPADTINIAYSQTLAATGGTGALTWSLQSGSLPAGLSLSAGGAITGTPTASGTSSFTAKATDTVGASATKALSIVINAAVTVTTASLPADTINVAYPSTTLGATGGTGSLTWSLSSGSLPAGLALSAGGAITGTPTATGTSNFTARATDTVGASGTKALSIVINAAPSITTASLPADTISIAYSQALASTGGTAPLAWSILSGSLPAGLSIVSGTGVISGTPTASGTSNFTAKVTDNVGASASKALSIVINAAPSITTSSLPGGTVGAAYSQSMASTGGTSPITWSILSGSLPGGLSLAPSTGAITGTPTASGTSNFTAKVTDNVGASATQALSIVITGGVTITTASLPADTINIVYNQTLAASGGTTPYTWSIQSGSLPAGLSLSASTGAITGTPTATGTSSFTAKVTDNVSATASKALSITINAAVNITTASLPADTINIAYSQTLSATGGTGSLTWSIQSGTLPAGLSLNSSTGAITGTPTASGTSSFTAKATDTVSASATKALAIVINAAVSITTASLPGGSVGVAYNQTMASTGGTSPLTWSILSGSLPAGLSLTAATGAITGTPTASGTSNFTAKVMDNVGASATQALSITITAAPVITTASLPADTINIPYNQTLAASGGTTPYTWSIQSGSLPAGLSLTPSTGAITGTPTASGTSNFTAKVTDNVGATATKALSIVINAAVSITTASLPADTTNIAYNQTLSATGGTGALTWSIQSGTLPAGLSLNGSTGAITGTPTASGTSNFTAKATDTVTASATKALSIVINAAVTITTTTLPGGTVGTAYSQTLASTGGTTPVTWSLQSGSLPAGLSLVASTGAITGTPTASGTSNFTAKVTDNVAATATQALSIVVASGGTSATYQFVASDTEGSTTSTNWVNKATMTFTPNASDDWLVFAFAELKESSTSYRNQIQFTIDAAAAQDSDVAPKDATDYQSFEGMKVVTLSAASHTFNIDYRSNSASGTAYIRNARIVAIRKSSLELYSNDGGDTGSDLTTTETSYATLTFTPSATATYLFLYSAEWNAATTSYNTVIEGCMNNGTQYTFDSTTVTSSNTANWYTFLGNKTASLSSGVAITAAVKAYKQSGSSATHHIKHARVAVFNLDSGRFSHYQMQRDDNETTTTSTTFQQKITEPISVATAQNWFVMCTLRLANSSTSYSSEAQVQLNNTTTLANPMRRPMATTDYFQCGCVNVNNLSTGTQTFDQDFRTGNASGTAKCTKSHFMALPLDSNQL